MAVHKKQPTFASASVKTTADKEASAGKEEKPAFTSDMAEVTSDLAEATANLAEVESHLADAKSSLVDAKEDVVASNVAPEAKAPNDPTPAENPLSEFKEKMVEEELSVPGDAPKKNYMWPILFIFIAAILLLTGVFLYRQGANTSNKVNVVELSPTPNLTPEPTKAIDLTKYEIEILNGSTVTGEAGRQKASLEEAGFTISSIGNADNSDFTDTIIKAKKEVEKAFLDKLKTVLESSFIVTQEVLPDTASVPVEVIIGTKK